MRVKVRSEGGRSEVREGNARERAAIYAALLLQKGKLHTIRWYMVSPNL